MNVLKKRIAVLMGEVTTKCAILTATTEHDFFCEFQSHVGCISVYVHVGGYTSRSVATWLGGGVTNVHCNINCNDKFMSNDDTMRFDDEWHDNYSINRLNLIIAMLDCFISGSADVTKDIVGQPIPNCLEFVL